MGFLFNTRLAFVGLLASAMILGASADNSVGAQVTKYTLDITNTTSEAQHLAKGVYGSFCSISSFSGAIVALTLEESCTVLSSLPNVSSPIVAVVSRGNCTFLQKALSASSRGAVGMIVQDYPNQGVIVMGGGLLLPFPCIAVDYNTGVTLLAGTRANVSVSPISTEDSQDNIPLYTKTAIFAILCILVVFVLFIYCQSSVRHYLAVNAFRTHQRQLEQQNLVLQQRATARIRELPIVEYKHDGAAGDRAVCAICLEELQDGLRVRKLPCQHLYHVDCIDPWLTSNRTCPLCKADILDPGPGEDTIPAASADSTVVVNIPPSPAGVLPGSVATTPENSRRTSDPNAGVAVGTIPENPLSSPPATAAPAATAATGVPVRRVSGMSNSESRVSMGGPESSELSTSSATAAATALASLSPAFYYPTAGSPLSPVLGLTPSTAYANPNGAGGSGRAM